MSTAGVFTPGVTLGYEVPVGAIQAGSVQFSSSAYYIHSTVDSSPQVQQTRDYQITKSYEDLRENRGPAHVYEENAPAHPTTPTDDAYYSVV